MVLGQLQNKACATLSKINRLIQEAHYKPKPIDDSLSVYVFNTFLNKLDEDNRLFILPEIDELSKHKLQIDDYIKSKDCSFLNDFLKTYKIAIGRYPKIISEIKTEPFEFSSEEKIVFSRKHFPYPKDESALKHIYKKRILFDVLKDISELTTNKDSLIQNFDSLSKLYKTKTIDKYECKNSSFQLSEDEFLDAFYNAFCSYFDPHTEYFSQSEKSSFFSAVSSDNLSFGFYSSINEKEEIIVESIVPGSSAYASEKISIGDKLLKIISNNQELEMDCASMKKIEEIISSNEYKKGLFTFRKKSGDIYSVPLEKKILKDYENTVYSYTIDKDKFKFGYIKIPSFYSTFENGKSNVSEDVVKEIFKLKKDKIDGLIVDIQNNGGGSMEEAIRLSSIFIDNGPLAVMNNNKNNKEVLKDNLKGTFYDDAMVVMINGFSASASEFFCNAMQDYNRAIVIGTKSLGKASMQRIFPLDNSNNEFLKLTLEKFYRITGKSNQYTGITPDVEIESLFDKQMPRENSYPTALKNDEIKIRLSFKNLSSAINKKAIGLSKKRLEVDKNSFEISELNKRIQPLYDENIPPIQLDFNNVYTDINKIKSLWKEIKDQTEKEYPISISNNSTDIEFVKNDDFLISNNKERIKQIKQNFHILEATEILKDLKSN